MAKKAKKVVAEAPVVKEVGKPVEEKTPEPAPVAAKAPANGTTTPILTVSSAAAALLSPLMDAVATADISPIA